MDSFKKKLAELKLRHLIKTGGKGPIVTVKRKRKGAK